jgi:hypothetical protein
MNITSSASRIYQRLDIIPAIRAFIVPLILVDFTFFPMFHLGNIPWKPGYLAIVFISVWVVASGRSNAIKGDRLKFLVLFGVLATTVMIGSFVFYMQTDVAPSNDTARSISIFIMAPAAFIVGTWVTPRTYHFVIWLMVAFLGLNLFLEVFHDDFDWLISFYGLGPQLSREYYETRAVGVFANPNITALTTTILLIFVLAGRKSGGKGFARFDFVIASWVAAATAVLMVSRNQFAAVGLLAAFAALRTGLRAAWRQSIILLALVLAIFVVAYAANDPIEDAIGFNPQVRLVERLQLGLQGEDSAKEDSVSRPLLYLTPAIDRWSRSPIVGTGFESSEEFEAPNYHNDWLVVAASSGVIGLIAFTVVVYLLVRIEPLLLVLFVFPALTNSLVFAPQHLTAVMVLAGIAAMRQEQKRSAPVVISP